MKHNVMGYPASCMKGLSYFNHAQLLPVLKELEVFEDITLCKQGIAFTPGTPATTTKHFGSWIKDKNLKHTLSIYNHTINVCQNTPQNL